MGRAAKIRTLLSLYGLSSIPSVVAIARGRPVPVPGLGVRMPNDSAVFYHLTNSVEKITRLADYVEVDELVFDVGAHAGLFTVAAARRGARVVAVEPDPDVAALLRDNVAAFDVEVVEAAVTDSGGTETLWRVPESTQTSSVIRDAAETFGRVEEITVEAVTLDDLAAKFGTPDVVKLDIQGYESRLLDSPLWNQVRVALVEVSDLDPDADKVVDVLSRRVGAPHQVNEVSGGADLAFVRSR